MNQDTENSGESRPTAWLSGDGNRWTRRRFVQTGAAFASLAATGGFLAACGSDSDSEAEGETGKADSDVTFGFSNPYGDIPVIASVKRLVEDAAKDAGWEVLLDETQGGKLQEQQATLDAWITQKITAINAFPSEPSAFETVARRVVDAGIIWTTYATRMETSAGGVLFPAQASGEVTGEATVEWLKANDPAAEVLILESTLTGELRKRTNIARKMITDQTDATIVAVQPAIDQVKGLQVTEDVLQTHPNLNVVVSINDDAGLGAAEAFRKAGKKDPSKVWIIGADGSKDALTALQQGNTFFRASAALDLPKMGEEIIAVNKRAIERGWKPGDEQDYVDLPPTLIKVGDTEAIERALSAYSAG